MLRHRHAWTLGALLALVACGDGSSTGEEDLDARGGRDAAVTPDGADDAADTDAGPADVGRDTPPADTGADLVDTTEPQPPVADAGGDRGGVPNVSIRFDGSGSTDPDGQIVQWEWDFGNGDSRTGVVANYAYANPGVYTVTLTVTDDDGLTDTDEAVIDLQEENDPPQAIIRGPFEVIAGEEAEWNALESTDDVALVAWEWDVGVEGVDPLPGQRLDYTYEDWGVYTMTLTVVDTDGVEDLETRSIDVLAAPVPLFDGPSQGFVGEEIQFDGTESFDPDAREGAAANGIVNYRWEWDDGSPALDGPPYGSHVFTEAGSYDVSLVVTDADGIERQSPGRKLDIFDVPNVDPTPVISAERFVVDECEEVTLDGSLSSDDTDAPGDLRYIWDFGDGGVLTGISVRYDWERAGEYAVQLTALDSEGGEGTATRTMVVENLAPTAQFTSPAEGLVGELVRVDAEASSDGCVGSVATYQWDWGDGTVSEPSTSPTASHTYDAPDTYDITLIVTDDDPTTPATAQRTRSIEVGADVDPVPVISASTFTADECEIIEFDASLSVDDRDELSDLRFLWDFGDGTSRSGLMVEKAYTREGSYEVTLTVTDSAGNMGEVTRFVDVANIAPTAFFSMPSTVVVGTNLNVDAAGSSDGCLGEIVSYRWNWGDGVMSTGSASTVASHAYDELGTYDVTLTVRDDGDPSLTDTATQRINVIEESVGPLTYVSEPPVTFRCAGGSVNAFITSVQLDETPTSFTVDPGNTQPGPMIGTRTGDTFEVSSSIPTAGIGCSEFYEMTGEFQPDGSIVYDFTADFDCNCAPFPGFPDICVDCVLFEESAVLIPE